MHLNFKKKLTKIRNWEHWSILINKVTKYFIVRNQVLKKIRVENLLNHYIKLSKICFIIVTRNLFLIQYVSKFRIWWLDNDVTTNEIHSSLVKSCKPESPNIPIWHKKATNGLSIIKSNECINIFVSQVSQFLKYFITPTTKTLISKDWSKDIKM